MRVISWGGAGGGGAKIKAEDLGGREGMVDGYGLGSSGEVCYLGMESASGGLNSKSVLSAGDVEETMM